jgi:hypothetical protein
VVAPGVSTFIVWAIGPVSPETGLPQFHTIYPRGVDFQLEFGREVKDNCTPLAAKVEETPKVPYEIPVLKDVTEIVARIGPSGGDRVGICSTQAFIVFLGQFSNILSTFLANRDIQL